MLKVPIKITESDFEELCRFICFQINLSSSKHLDKETLSFALFWQISVILELKIDLSGIENLENTHYPILLQTLIDKFSIRSFVSSIIVEKVFRDFYPTLRKNLNSEPSKSANFSENPLQTAP